MKTVRTPRIRIAAGIVFLSLLAVSTAGVEAKDVSRPRIQMAILLDTSGSMSGLIDQARTQLWKVVNEFVVAKRDGLRPELQVALYEYGKSSIPATEGYLRRILPLTTDLDRVSEELFALTTNGGDEYCGTVIQSAVNGLSWSRSPEDLKVIFIAGNEPFTQGEVDYRVACREAISRSIIVNTIHCGPHATGESTGWKDGALLADGSFASIDHNREVVHIAAPQDEEIARLGVELNRTYVPYGAQGEEGASRQAAQDANATRSGAGSSTQRALSKGSTFYRNSDWDLVDAVKEKKLELEKIDREDLPEELREMSVEELEKYLAAKREEREKIQARIRELDAERKKYVAEEMKERSEMGEETLDRAMVRSLREQAAKKRIELE